MCTKDKHALELISITIHYHDNVLMISNCHVQRQTLLSVLTIITRPEIDSSKINRK